MTVQELLADAVLAGRDSLRRFLPGFTEQNCAQQAPQLPNHLVWTLGHLALFLHAAAAELDKRPPLGDGFGQGGGSAGQFDVEAITFGSQPAADGARYPTLPRAVAIVESAFGRLADAVRDALAQDIERRVNWHGMEVPLGLLVLRVVFHAGFHTGQVADLRRALGLKRVLQ